MTKYERFLTWYSNQHPLIRTLVSGTIGGSIGTAIGLFIRYQILHK